MSNVFLSTCCNYSIWLNKTGRYICLNCNKLCSVCEYLKKDSKTSPQPRVFDNKKDEIENPILDHLCLLEKSQFNEDTKSIEYFIYDDTDSTNQKLQKFQMKLNEVIKILNKHETEKK